MADGDALKRGSHASSAPLRAAIRADVDAHNGRGTPFNWVKTADEILDSMRRVGLRLQQVHGQMASLILEITDPLGVRDRAVERIVEAGDRSRPARTQKARQRATGSRTS